MGKNITGGFIRDASIAAVIAVLGAVLVKYADLPTRVSVVENDVQGIKEMAKSMDAKLDLLIQRTK